MPRPGLDFIADRDTPDRARSSTVGWPRKQRDAIERAPIASFLVPFMDG